MYPDFAALGRAVVGGAVGAANYFLPSKEKSTLYSGRVVEHYKNLAVNASPTKNKAINVAARTIFAIAAIVPYMIATIGAGLADVAVMTSKNLSKAYSLIKNRFSKKVASNRFKNVLQFVNKNKMNILGGIVLATAYYYRAPIAKEYNKRVFEFNLRHAKGFAWAKMRFFG